MTYATAFLWEADFQLKVFLFVITAVIVKLFPLGDYKAVFTTFSHSFNPILNPLFQINQVIHK